MDENYYCQSSTGLLQFDPGAGTKYFKKWWLLLKCDDEIVRYYKWFLLKYGFPVQHNALWGAHISVIKGEEIPDDRKWNWDAEIWRNLPLEFYYSHYVRNDNSCHHWIDCYSKGLSAFREYMGLSPKLTYHLTIGRIDCFCEDHKKRKLNNV